MSASPSSPSANHLGPRPRPRSRILKNARSVFQATAIAPADASGLLSGFGRGWRKRGSVHGAVRHVLPPAVLPRVHPLEPDDEVRASWLSCLEPGMVRAVRDG